ncbi:cytochrome c biogenesis factor [Xenococcus sp. PCC 7305]|uniref:DUF3137 domain-containing protein n=1 Tax=Xenococcus sp. PCC 7305 TaxID=102125 RepID=UPI0002AC6B4D|nr:DUF3137 domain-containing protein [Xenococcus sp. PCC 7305]ELS01819.1 cytochrome c biogenesis factor [Xenococcus sp. PCC 7305]
MNQQEIQGLFIKGDRALQTGDYAQAIELFEQLSREIDVSSPHYFHIQRGLAKAYYQNQAIDKAIALCTEIIANSSSGNRLWGEQLLATITGESIAEKITDTESDPNKKQASKPIKLKSLTEFKNYCRANLLPQLKELEHKRIQALISIIISGIICILLSGAISYWLTFFLIPKDSFSIFFLMGLVCLFPVWLIFCRSCIQVYGLGFKRKIIEKIVNFIDSNNTLDYASHLFLLDQHHTEACFRHSQLFNKNTEIPNFLEQEDCIYGKVGDTDIFFAEILVERTSSLKERFTANLSDLSPKIGSNNPVIRTCWQTFSLILNTILYLIVLVIKLEQTESIRQKKPYPSELTYKPSKTKIFRGLFFVAKFPKKFESRIFILPKTFTNKIYKQSWRGQTIRLEDPELNQMFDIYGDSQLESRFILSTSLMNRLVNFQKKANRKVHISFVDGHVCIAIRYHHNLFEPKIFTSMLSFAPLREYFESLQLMIGIVQDLNLNQKIWQTENG